MSLDTWWTLRTLIEDKPAVYLERPRELAPPRDPHWKSEQLSALWRDLAVVERNDRLFTERNFELIVSRKRTLDGIRRLA